MNFNQFLCFFLKNTMFCSVFFFFRSIIFLINHHILNLVCDGWIWVEENSVHYRKRESFYRGPNLYLHKLWTLTSVIRQSMDSLYFYPETCDPRMNPKCHTSSSDGFTSSRKFGKRLIFFFPLPYFISLFFNSKVFNLNHVRSFFAYYFTNRCIKDKDRQFFR